MAVPAQGGPPSLVWVEHCPQRPLRGDLAEAEPAELRKVREKWPPVFAEPRHWACGAPFFSVWQMLNRSGRTYSSQQRGLDCVPVPMASPWSRRSRPRGPREALLPSVAPGPRSRPCNGVWSSWEKQVREGGRCEWTARR